MVFVVSPARIGSTASLAANLPAATSEATDTAAECVSAKPATVAAARTPALPSHALSAADAKRKGLQPEERGLVCRIDRHHASFVGGAARMVKNLKRIEKAWFPVS